MAQLVEHILGKDEVISSNLITSSRSPVGESPRGFCFLALFVICVNVKSPTDFLSDFFYVAYSAVSSVASSAASSAVSSRARMERLTLWFSSSIAMIFASTS